VYYCTLDYRQSALVERQQPQVHGDLDVRVVRVALLDVGQRDRGDLLGLETALGLLRDVGDAVAGTYVMPSFGRYEQAAELVRRLRAESRPVAFDAVYVEGIRRFSVLDNWIGAHAPILYSPRAGLLTFWEQGCEQFEPEKEAGTEAYFRRMYEFDRTLEFWAAFALRGKIYDADTTTVLVDYNHMQSYGTTAEVLSLEPFADKWRSFNWTVCEIDGHDHDAIKAALHAPHDRIEQIAERDAGGERRDRAAKQVEEVAERRQRSGPYEDLAFKGHGATVAWRLAGCSRSQRPPQGSAKTATVP